MRSPAHFSDGRTNLIPAEAGIYRAAGDFEHENAGPWIPAFAGIAKIGWRISPKSCAGDEAYLNGRCRQ